ncbi:MAG: STAS domain-containing protein [Oscillatoriaceae cyanobacterium Prado104]|jgi:anti-anti-sigma regulatory factor|nr:STAS domain-containing protein [Oscillatoriaceae cyanobacterium Prado104]
MKTASISNPKVACSFSIKLDLETTAPKTVVLQPKGCLCGIAVLDFQTSLEQALETASEKVVVDLRQVETVSADGIAALAGGLELAAVLGKSLIFYAMDLASRKSLRAECRRSREICFGPWGDLFEGEFEQFFGGEFGSELLRSVSV